MDPTRLLKALVFAASKHRDQPPGETQYWAREGKLPASEGLLVRVRTRLGQSVAVVLWRVVQLEVARLHFTSCCGAQINVRILTQVVFYIKVSLMLQCSKPSKFGGTKCQPP